MTKNESDQQPLVDRLNQDILLGLYRPGEWLKQADLEAAYGSNRFEVRTALRDLANRRLLEHLPNRGYRVYRPSDQECRDLDGVRTILERAAAKEVVERITAAEIQQLRVLAAEFEEAVENAGYREQRRANFAFHRTFYEVSGNQLLAELIRELRERGLPNTLERWRSIAGLRQSSREHFEMLEAMEARDASRLATIVDRHINRP